MSTAYLPLACYGKLPIHREYLEKNVKHPSSRFFRDWIHEGRREVLLDDTPGDDVDSTRSIQETRSWRFLHGLSGSAELIAGVIRPSTDGLRGFPFALLTHFLRRPYGRHYGVLPLALEPVWQALDDTWDTLEGLPSKSAFEEAIVTARVPAPIPVRDARRDYAAGLDQDLEFFTERGDEATLGRLDEALPGGLTRLRKGSAESPVRMELPVSVDLPTAGFDSSFWMDLIDHQFRWRHFEPSVFLDSRPSRRDRTVVLVFGDLRPEDYRLVMRPTRSIPGDDGATSERRAIGTAERPAHGGAADPSDPGWEGSYADLLRRRFA